MRTRALNGDLQHFVNCYNPNAEYQHLNYANNLLQNQGHRIIPNMNIDESTGYFNVASYFQGDGAIELRNIFNIILGVELHDYTQAISGIGTILADIDELPNGVSVEDLRTVMEHIYDATVGADGENVLADWEAETVEYAREICLRFDLELFANVGAEYINTDTDDF